VQSNCSYTGYELQQLFEEKGIYAEMAEPNNILFVLTLLKKDAEFPFGDIITRLKGLRIQEAKKRERTRYFNKKRISTLYRVQSHKKALFPIEDSAGSVC
ncbi:arginine decarboxylase, partial [Robertmurraya sp. DFI.2.37]|nr:arginine decarboxylase [Robertmurraya sp. DFI.2.37]